MIKYNVIMLGDIKRDFFLKTNSWYHLVTLYSNIVRQNTKLFQGEAELPPLSPDQNQTLCSAALGRGFLMIVTTTANNKREV